MSMRYLYQIRFAGLVISESVSAKIICLITKFKMADVRHIGNLKNHHNSAAIGDIATKIGMLIDMKLLKLFSRHE